MPDPLRGPRRLEPVGVADRDEAALGEQGDEGVRRIVDRSRRRDLVEGRQRDLASPRDRRPGARPARSTARSAALRSARRLVRGTAPTRPSSAVSSSPAASLCDARRPGGRATGASPGRSRCSRAPARRSASASPGLSGCIAATAGQPGCGGRAGDPRAREAVAPAREGRPGDQELGAAGARLLDERGGELRVPGGVVVAADGGRDDLVLVAEDRRQAAPGTQRDRRGAGSGAGGVLAADAREELVDVVDDLHQAASWQVSRPQPSGLSAQ